MIKHLIYIYVLTIVLACADSKTNDNVNIKINGVVPQNISNNDNIIFSNGFIDVKYFEESVLNGNINESKFILKTNLSYPHLFSLSFNSEKDSILFRGGNYFIDSSTNYIKIDSLEKCNIIKGNTYEEYINKFIPFFLKEKDNCRETEFQYFTFFNKKDFDDKLYGYTKNNPNSYVALWFLVKRVNVEGHTTLYEDILKSFSKELKHEKLWNTLNEDLKNVRIIENQKFPTLTLKNRKLNTTTLELPKAKYILIDYWFNRCIPCLNTFPKLKKLYADYHSKGFEIISISVDKTEEISNWDKRIKEHDLNWLHYLDENGIEANTDKIFSYPTTFLLNEKGEVIYKNIDLNKLEELLKSL